MRGTIFDFAICHSNGCTNAFRAQADGDMNAAHILALGTDWKSKDVQAW